ncbi:EXORDIUM like 3 [Hibiscus trionum]|uniref:EXORDIUM like 3 n=1 Tax=Hibiscus trionum TaxID=183268 RepID=A0A9W7MMI5_HIBTR|nr:EXORDIUM like 3 [Hibiscus trionum]
MLLTAVAALLIVTPVIGYRPRPDFKPNSSGLNLVDIKYHMGPVLTANITIHPIWYGPWRNSQKNIIRDFINSISAVHSKNPSVAGWWKTVQLYTDRKGANVSRTVLLGEEVNDRFYSHGKSLSRSSIQSVIKSAVTAAGMKRLPINSGSGLYLLLTSDDVYVQDFCTQICAFHGFMLQPIVGYTRLLYAWVGNSAELCPETCAFPFAVPEYMAGFKALKSPNGDVGVDGMISLIGHEVAELATDPLGNAWYGGQEMARVEIADMCEGIYGTRDDEPYTGSVLKGKDGATYNMNGIKRRYLVQWVWNHVVSDCTGPNALVK